MKKLSCIIPSIIIALFILSASIAVPILFRGLYYSQIDSLKLVESTGYSEEIIRDAFDEMMDYCTKGGENSGLDFGTGELAWSQEGESHFDDVARLFSLDLNVLKVSMMLLILYLALRFFRSAPEEDSSAEADTAADGCSRSPLFWGPAGLLGFIAIVGAAAAINFDRFFVLFHKLFFPGKDNWLFDERYDEIIKILPEEVFRNFAIVIGLSCVVLCAAFMAADFAIGRATASRATANSLDEGRDD